MSEVASEILGQRERPYDMRWGTPEQVKDQFGINVAVLKAAWKRGWVRARQGNWGGDDKRTQTVYCFEDIHGWLERVAHRVSDAYAEKWWTDETVTTLEEKMPDGPYLRPKARRSDIGAGANRGERGADIGAGANTGGRSRLRKDGFAPLPRTV